MKLILSVENVINSLNITWQGMAIIFLTMTLVFFLIKLLSRVKDRKE